MSAEAGKKHKDYLVDTVWLEERLSSPTIRVVDCSLADSYWLITIPGAVKLPAPDLKDPDKPLSLITVDQMCKLLEDISVSEETEVVAYDGTGGHQYFGVFTCRLWWVLNCYGHSRVKVLNGGWRKWFYEGRPVTEMRPVLPQVSPRAKYQPQLIATAAAIRDSLGKAGVVLWDVRSQREYAGTGGSVGRRPGHIPGAVNLDWRDLLRNESYHTFGDSQQLIKLLESSGIKREAEVIVYSRNGVESAVACFVLKMLGYESVRNYEGSWLEWTEQEHLPVER